VARFHYRNVILALPHDKSRQAGPSRRGNGQPRALKRYSAPSWLSGNCGANGSAFGGSDYVDDIPERKAANQRLFEGKRRV
jgi:hypothetical protein